MPEKSMRVAWVAGATLDVVPFRPYLHDCYWGPASFTCSFSNTLRDSETSAVPKPRLVCSHGFMISEKPFKSTVELEKKKAISKQKADA